MAELIECGTCGRTVRASLRLCPGCSQDPRVRAQRAVSLTSAVDAATAQEQIACTEPGCSGTVAATGERCPICDSPIGGTIWRLLGLDPPIDLQPGMEVVLGRAEGTAAAALASYPNVSKRHARLRLDAAEAWVTDLGSLNGTFIDGRRLARDRPERVAASVELRLGATVVLQLERAS